MNTRMKAAFWSYLIALLLLAIFGLIYLFRPQFMPYHGDAVGMSWEEVPHAFRILIIALMKSLDGINSFRFFALLVKRVRTTIAA